MKITKFSKKIVILCLIWIVVFNEVALMNVSRLKRIKKNASVEKALDFLGGFLLAFNNSIDASEKLKKCFVNSGKDLSKRVNDFFKGASETPYNDDEKLKDLEKKTKDKGKEIKQLDKPSESFISLVFNLVKEIAICPAFQSSFLSFITHKIINFGIKALLLLFTGPVGLIIKSSIDAFWIIKEIISFYKLMKEVKKDYVKLGGCVGRIAKNLDNLLFKKFKKMKRIAQLYRKKILKEE